VEILEAPLAQPVTPEMLAARLTQGRFDVVTMVQGETSCGVLTPALPELVRLARDHGALTVVDAVCTLSTMPFEKDAWGIDVAFTGSQKGLSAPPGVSMICFSVKAWQVAAGRKGPKPHWCYDVVRAQRFWGEHDYHYTAPVSGLLALHEALRLVCEERLEARFERHRRSSEALQAGLEAMGLSLMAPKEWRLNSVLAIDVPPGVDAGRARQQMCTRHKVEISGAFGLNIVRIGQMGEQCRATNLLRTLHALGAAFEREGAKLDRAAGLKVLDEGCQELH
jgi:aspartate aminotransferase-like enzyme